MNSKPEFARQALLEACRRYAGRRKDLDRIWVVFDGQEEAADLPAGETGGVHEIYTRPGETADKRIAKIVRDASGTESWVVISSDRGVFDRCRSLGAESRKSLDFWRELEPKSSRTAASSGHGSAAEESEKKISARDAVQITQEYKQHLGLS